VRVCKRMQAHARFPVVCPARLPPRDARLPPRRSPAAPSSRCRGERAPAAPGRATARHRLQLRRSRGAAERPRLAQARLA
jgi:hypothetical protein